MFEIPRSTAKAALNVLDFSVPTWCKTMKLVLLFLLATTGS